MCMYMYVYVCICPYLYVYVYMSCMHICIQITMQCVMNTYTHVHLDLYVCKRRAYLYNMYLRSIHTECIHVCMYVCMYVWMYIYIEGEEKETMYGVHAYIYVLHPIVRDIGAQCFQLRRPLFFTSQ